MQPTRSVGISYAARRMSDVRGRRNSELDLGTVHQPTVVHTVWCTQQQCCSTQWGCSLHWSDLYKSQKVHTSRILGRIALRVYTSARRLCGEPRGSRDSHTRYISWAQMQDVVAQGHEQASDSDSLTLSELTHRLRLHSESHSLTLTRRGSQRGRRGRLPRSSRPCSTSPSRRPARAASPRTAPPMPPPPPRRPLSDPTN